VNWSRAVLYILAVMSGDQGDMLWEAFVVAMLAAGPAVERRSRYGDKPALFTASREIAHLEAPGVIDLRITRAGWSRVRRLTGSDTDRGGRGTRLTTFTRSVTFLPTRSGVRRAVRPDRIFGWSLWPKSGVTTRSGP
jgi:hypothetical protein